MMKVPVGNKLYTTRKDSKRPRLFVEKNGVIEYLELTPDKNLTNPGNKFYVILNDIRHYIKELFVIMGEYLVFKNTFRASDGWSQWYGSKAPVKNYGFINGISIKIKSTIGKSIMHLYQEVKITNAKDGSCSITKLQKWIVQAGGGALPPGTLNATINLTQEDLKALGGSDTEILIDYRTYIKGFLSTREATTEIIVSTF